MASIGAEVGQKMRSAIKAKLLELNCYVDDELPDYVMVMVANKRTKSQMKEDLQLFLAAKTATFVDWLHIVLKKLKEVTVTNPEVYKKTVKRKSDDTSNINIKKEKKVKTEKKSKKAESIERTAVTEDSVVKSLTDDLPISANRLSEQRKIIIMKENKSNNNSELLIHDNFDIPLLSEVTTSTEEELKDLERKIKNVKSRLGILVESDTEEDCINLKAEPDELFTDSDTQNVAKTSNSSSTSKKSERVRITFDTSQLETECTTKRKSILERLGKRRSSDTHKERSSSPKKSRGNSADRRRKDEDRKKSSRSDNFRNRSKDNGKPKEGILSRLGVMSKVSIPVKQPEEPEEPFKGREVPSVIKIKPRSIPPNAPQPNKNLLLKAVAEAQRSVAQAPKVGNSLKPEALYTKAYKGKKDSSNNKDKKCLVENKTSRSVVSEEESEDSLYEDEEENMEYIPTPSKASSNTPKYIPSAKLNKDAEEKSPETSQIKQQFIVTLDGIEKTKFKDLLTEINNPKPSIKSRLDKKRSPSPIIFDKVSAPVKTKSNIPDKLPIVHAPSSVKNKERCKYWPSCRQGEKCEFVHPSSNCEKFPHCKFGDRCLFLHPSCKFGSSCTRRDCTYSHIKTAASKLTSLTTGKIQPQALQTCKFFPNCTNSTCTFYHPKPCKFGKYCKNQAECNFTHAFIPNKSSLTWRSK